MSTNNITVVIPSLNAASTIGFQIQSLLSQRGAPDFEVIIVDNGSQDNTNEVAVSFRNSRIPIRVVWEPRRGINIARNTGISCAPDGIILICDADDLVSDYWVKNLSDAVSLKSWATGPAVMFSWESSETCLGSSSPGIFKPVTYLDTLGGNCGFTKSMWSNLGGFNEGLSGPGDETEFFVRAHHLGYRQIVVDSAWIYYRRKLRTRSHFLEGFRKGMHHAKVAHCDGGSYLRSGSRRWYALLRLTRSLLSIVKHVWSRAGRAIILNNLGYWNARLIAPRSKG